ncbi:MAG: molybdopterin-synthase adenylyltransferase MoeB [Ignavibacteria bacterium]|nr:molybdopterin-synthase adenylyltransferase MoeB [Ignavibacteria bacterium]
MPTILSQDELKRYARHLVLPEVGEEGQRKLKQSSVLIVGAGGLGSPVALYLAASGVGRIGLVDLDKVDAGNLQRQILYSTEEVGKPKLHSAAGRLRGLNPTVEIQTLECRLTSSNALGVLKQFDVVVDATDNFPSRYLISDAGVLLEKPDVYGSIFRFEGQASVFAGKNGPCYRCLYPEPPPPGLIPACDEAGVLGVVPGVIGAIQANEAIKLIVGIGDPLIGRLLMFDALSMRFNEIAFKKNPECPACGDHPTVSSLIDYDTFCGVQSEGPARTEESIPQISVRDLKKKFDSGEGLFILDVREPYEYRLANLSGHLIPLMELPKRMNELDSSREIIVHCHHGIRSAFAVSFLRKAGFQKAVNLVGGIDQWSKQIDPAVPRY